KLGLEIPQSLADVCRPDRMAILVYDMQAGITRRPRDGPTIVERVARILAAARQSGYRVVFARRMSLPPRWMGTFQLRQARAWQWQSGSSALRSPFLRGSPAFELAAEIAPRDDEVVLDKISFSAFEGTPLAMILRDCGLSAFAVAGIAMEIGIEPTVRHGADLGLIPVVPRDACGAGNAEAGARSLAAIAFMGDAIFADTDGLCAAMSAKSER